MFCSVEYGRHSLVIRDNREIASIFRRFSVLGVFIWQHTEIITMNHDTFECYSTHKFFLCPCCNPSSCSVTFLPSRIKSCSFFPPKIPNEQTIGHGSQVTKRKMAHPTKSLFSSNGKYRKTQCSNDYTLIHFSISRSIFAGMYADFRFSNS